jgi:hypothetical protein
MMADYQLTATDIVIRTADQAHIPDDPANRDRAEYEEWIASGGLPDPYVPPPTAPPEPAPETTVLYDHENRIRAMEGQPPLTVGEFLGKAMQPAPQANRKRK